MADQTGDENDNTINGTSGDDTIRGRDGNDTLNGADGNDVIVGGKGNDDIDGGFGNDSIYGGDGDDTITGGGGQDTIEGGRGNDTMAAGNSSTTDTFVIRDGDGNDTLTDFDPGEPDIIAFDMTEISSYQDILDRISQDGPDTLITYDNGSTTRLLSVDSTNLSATNFQTSAAPACFLAGTLIATQDGPLPVETLRPGCLVLTNKGVFEPILQVIVQRLHFNAVNDPAVPILIKKDAFSPGYPCTDTALSPQHRLLMADRTGDPQAFVAVKKLTTLKGIRQLCGKRSATYYNLLFHAHEVVFANGLAAESMLLTAYTAPLVDGCIVALHKAPAYPIAKNRDATWSPFLATPPPTRVEEAALQY